MHVLWEADVAVFKAHITTGPSDKVLDLFWIYDNKKELPENHRSAHSPVPCTRSLPSQNALKPPYCGAQTLPPLPDQHFLQFPCIPAPFNPLTQPHRFAFGFCLPNFSGRGLARVLKLTYFRLVIVAWVQPPCQADLKQS